MYGKREKLQRIRLISLALVMCFCLLAMFQTTYTFIFFALCFVIISLLANALLLLISYRQTDALYQLIVVFSLLIIALLFFIRYLQGS